jgi:DNA-binding Xre family transcriptional regulator
MNQPNPYLIAICNQLEVQLGFKIKNIADAHNASAQMAALKLHISPHTIARLFGIVKPFRTPYKDTLNILARFVHYNDWEDFCDNQTNIPFDPNFFLTEASDGFSLAVLELALASEDFKALELVLEKAKANENQAVLFTAAELIGAYIRKSKKQKELLQLLADSTIGHLFYYECYVDEDNEENYFSNALLHHYLPKVTNDYRKLFVYCFIISQTAHKEQRLSTYHKEFQNLTAQLDQKNCHFHELSRWIECLILIDGYNGVLQNTWRNHVTELLALSVGYNANEKAWLLARPIKALLLFGFKEELFNCVDINHTIDTLIKSQKKELHSIALYVLQLYWIRKSMYFESKIVYNPFRIHNILFQNESYEKTAIEFAIASLFATGENKNILASNLKEYCKAKGVHWVIKLLE